MLGLVYKKIAFCLHYVERASRLAARGVGPAIPGVGVRAFFEPAGMLCMGRRPGGFVPVRKCAGRI
jgi:hypothetical protein